MAAKVDPGETKAPTKSARLIVDPPSGGAWNMSVDQVLLNSAETLGLTTLRFYQWSEPTLSLGYFQSYKDRQKHIASADCKLIRRASGGGAIVHHHELTYSLCLPSANRWSVRNSELYQMVHQIINAEVNDALTQHETSAQLFSDYAAAQSQTTVEVESSAGKNGPRPFLCFLRRTDGDIVIGENKIVGSAQRRLMKSLIQHGSILLARSEFAPELAGINDLGDRSADIESLISNLATNLAANLGLEFSQPNRAKKTMTATEDSLATEIMNSQFGSNSWNQRR